MLRHDPHVRDSTSRSPWGSPLQFATVLLACVLSRVATTIRHIEDADSLRFALGVLDFDVTTLQPQFPGYAAFMGVVKLLHALTGSYALAFSIVGGAGLFVLVHYGLKIMRWRFTEPAGLFLTALLLFNPMTWLLGNRYMSDLSGAACMLAAFHHLSRTDSRRHLLAGVFLTGILAGWRLSYAPFLLAPLVLAFALPSGTGNVWRTRAKLLASGSAGVLIWLVPLILDTGWRALIATAFGQTGAHFVATGGTYVTEPVWALRVQRTFAHLWTDGLGAWAPGRHPVTLLAGAGAATFMIRRLALLREPLGSLRTHRLLLLSCGIYLIWILLFQNVVHQTRHVLPLVPPLLMFLASGLAPTAPSGWRRSVLRVWKAAFLIAYAVVGTTLAYQHTKPAAIAQAKAHLETFTDSATVIVTAPWVEKCLSAQGVTARFISVETPGEIAALPERLRGLDATTRLVAVGAYHDVIHRPVSERRMFHHNPYVNRLGARVEVTVYGPSKAEEP